MPVANVAIAIASSAIMKLCPWISWYEHAYVQIKNSRMFNGDLRILQSNEDSNDSFEVKNNVSLDGVQNTN